MRVEPKLRPELTSIVGNVRLPEYLGQPEVQEKDARGGAVSLVKGSRVHSSPRPTDRSTAAHANKAVRAGRRRNIHDGRIRCRRVAAMSSSTGTTNSASPARSRSSSRSPPVDDEAPQLACEDLPRGRVVLDTEQLVFQVRAHDDFGVKQVGMAWRGVPLDVVEKPAKGGSMLAAGGHDKAVLDVQGTFTASSLGIEPQPIELRIFATDYFPGRKPVYTAPYLLYVLNAEQHAIWVTEQLAKWHRQSLEVRDRELQLYETNKQLRSLSADELDRPETRRRIESQATPSASTAAGCRTSRRTARSCCGRRPAIRRSASATSTSGPRCCKSWKTSRPTACRRSPTCSRTPRKRRASPPRPGKSGPMAGQSRAQGASAANDDDQKKRSK